MKNLLPLLIIPLLFSCNQQGWTESQKNNFISECIKSANGHKNGKVYCKCALERVIAKYPYALLADVAASTNSEEELMEMFQPCLDMYQ